MYEVGGISFESLKCEETDGVSRSSKQMPPKQRIQLHVATTWLKIIISTDQEGAGDP